MCNAEDRAKVLRFEPIDVKLSERLMKDVEKREYLERHTGQPVVYMTSCQWTRMKQNFPEVREEVARLKKHFDALDRPKPLYFKHRNEDSITEGEFARRVCNKVTSGEFFGFVKVDIEVPDHLKKFFSEFQPLVSTSIYSPFRRV